MSISLLNGNSKWVWVQFFLYEFISEKNRGFGTISPYKPDYQNPFNSINHWKAFPSIFLIPFEQGKGPWKIFQKDAYNLEDPDDYAFLVHIKWVKPPVKHRKDKHPSKNIKENRTLDEFINKSTPVKGKSGAKRVKKAEIEEKSPEIVDKLEPKPPHFQTPPTLEKDQFCSEMPDYIWAARDPAHSDKIGLSALFYLNQAAFNLFNDPQFCLEIGWSQQRTYQPADVIKLLIYQLLHGYSDIEHLFLHLEQADISRLKDHLGIPQSHELPSAHHFAEDLRQIGLVIIKKFFYFLRDEAVNLKIVQNKVHGIDGQFFRSWLCHPKPRRSGLPQFWGGWYNHGGAKKGVGVYQMPLVDISPFCVIPLHPHVVPANHNENVTGWETVEGAKQNYSKNSPYFVADCGLCGQDMQDQVKTRPSIPVIPIRENMKRNLYLSPKRHHRFSTQYLGPLKGALVDFLYDLRQAIERWHHFFDDVFDLVRIHACGKDHMLQIIITAEAITTLIAITALKICRPDLIQTPTAFLSLIGNPSEHYPISYGKINGKTL